MFKKAIIIILSVSIFASLFSCVGNIDANKDPAPSVTSSNEVLISILESKLSALQSSYSSSNEEAKKEIERLEKEIEKLKAKETTAPATAATTPAAPSIYRYRINEGKAIITGFVGNDEKIVIPSIVDGFEVVGIDEKAFSGYKITSVVISEGIEYLDWFAFYNCAQLTSVTIPSSVTKIGYGAFDGTSDGFTVYCHKESFAQSYAKSYGLPYAFI